MTTKKKIEVRCRVTIVRNCNDTSELMFKQNDTHNILKEKAFNLAIPRGITCEDLFKRIQRTLGIHFDSTHCQIRLDEHLCYSTQKISKGCSHFYVWCRKEDTDGYTNI